MRLKRETEERNSAPNERRIFRRDAELATTRRDPPLSLSLPGREGRQDNRCQRYLAGGTVRGFTSPQLELLKTAVASCVHPIEIVLDPCFCLATK